MKPQRMNYNITLYSTALFSTWINIEELNLLFDAGDGVCAGLLQKARKIKHVFITHPDRDHLTGLHQFVQLNARKDFPIIHYPKDSGSFPALQNFIGKFDPHVEELQWKAIQHGSELNIKPNIIVEALHNEHIPCPPEVNKSLSYKVWNVKHKLKPEFANYSGKEIKALIDEYGKTLTQEEQRENIISYSGNTPVDNYEKWNNSNVLIHEATFLKEDTKAQMKLKGNGHSTLEDVMQMVSEIEVKQLVLTHFSSRYGKGEITDAVLKSIKDYNIQIPVHVVYPGEVHRDILMQHPINA